MSLCYIYGIALAGFKPFLFSAYFTGACKFPQHLPIMPCFAPLTYCDMTVLPRVLCW